MKKGIARIGLYSNRTTVFFGLTLITIFVLNSGWGFWAHKRINKLAIETLPSKMRPFFDKHADSIRERAVAPDQRRKSDKTEGCRHFLDADHYGNAPFDSIPKTWQEAEKKYSRDTLVKYGVNPWHIEAMLTRLTNAFKAKNADSIVFLAADLGHYVADAHVPLHATSNYDGQLTGQKGIHALWESRVVEMDSNDFKFKKTKAVYLKDPLAEAWNILHDSYSLVDSVLTLDKKVKAEIPQDQWYVTKTVDGREQKTFTDAYTKRYDELLNGMVMRRLQASITDVGSFWYTAWVNAGKPDISKL